MIRASSSKNSLPESRYSDRGSAYLFSLMVNFNEVYIRHSEEFISTTSIEIGNGVHIFKNVRLDAKGHLNNRIAVGNVVAIERNDSPGNSDRG